ncbi:ArnT family glycosyltransferase [Paludisphaera rhizosphaerae]|uniref:ArnT family glycosyltransferase n=1 Tax=Paludisphaera rhizosphaerae TaxID=2711216 RepID=UPI0013EC98F3|nr:glycosyltransferase family 39 protein [Paludisphaera rhizosphaerae]
MTPARHATRIALLTAFAAVLLGRLAATTEVMYADGLRYVAAARAVDRGDWRTSVVRSVDHPVYPIAVAAAHRVLGLDDGPQGWQTAAQTVSMIAGAALVTPLYLVALELFGATSAWLACLLTFLVPTTGHVLADVLSEGTFLLFWTWGVWSALRFFRQGSIGWLLPTIALAGLAYLTRPEGLLLPVALAGTLMLTPLAASMRLPRTVWLRAAGLMVVGPTLIIGPYIAIKGGIGTKPAVARLLGTAPKSEATAVERARPLDPDQTALKAFAVSWREMFRAVQGAVTTPLLALAAFGILRRGPARDAGQSRGRLFVAIYGGLWMLALVRLFATGGYCTPRHALILALPLIAAAAQGVSALGERLAGRFAQNAGGRIPGLVSAAFAAVMMVGWGPQTLEPLNADYNGYREAGEWLAAHAAPDSRVFDLKGWALYYGDRPGYSFPDYPSAYGDPKLGYVVAHDAFLIGEWPYCQAVRDHVAGRSPVVSFPPTRRKGVAQVHVFELAPAVAGSTPSPSTSTQ